MPQNLLGDIGASWPVVQNPAPRLAAVFVHGWGGDYLKTWRYKPMFRQAHKSLIDYLAEDSTLPWRFFSVRHTGKAFEPAKIGDLANTIQTFLDTYVYKVADAVVLIAHSLGGLACRQLILNEIARLPRHQMQIAGLLMYGTPNDGTSMAKAAALLSSGTGYEMEAYSEQLRGLNAGWLEHIANGGNPGRNFDDRSPLLCWNVVGSADRVVRTSSASHMALLGNVKTISKGHLDMVKPVSANDVSIGIARDFLATAETRFGERARDYACDKVAAEMREAAASAPWVITEEESIELTPFDTDPSRFSGAKSLFRSLVKTVRTGVDCKAALNVGVRLDTATYDPGAEVVFDCSIGDGVVSSAVSGALRSGAVGIDTLNELVHVDRIEATHGTRTLKFAAQPIRGKDGWYLLPFACTDWPDDVARVDRLEVDISSVIDMAMGWYTFYAPNTVTNRLTVSFRSQFKTVCLMHEPLRSVAHVKENDVVGGEFLTLVRIDNPVAAGARITFVFRRDDGK